MDKPLLTYFPVRGRAELIRLILAQAGVDYDEHPVMKGTPEKNGRPTDFAALKASEHLPFAAVPTWEEPGGFRLAQSAAIAIYLASAHGLRGRDLREAALCDQMLGAYEDVRVEARSLVTTAADARAARFQELDATVLPRWLGYLERLLASHRDGTGWLVGDEVSYADLALFYIVEVMRDNGFTAPSRYPLILAHSARAAALPRIAAYLASPRRPAFLAFPR